MTLPQDDFSAADLLLPPDELDAMAEVSDDDVDNALEWWDAHATHEFRGILDEPQNEE